MIAVNLNATSYPLFPPSNARCSFVFRNAFIFNSNPYESFAYGYFTGWNLKINYTRRQRRSMSKFIVCWGFKPSCTSHSNTMVCGSTTRSCAEYSMLRRKNLWVLLKREYRQEFFIKKKISTRESPFLEISVLHFSILCVFQYMTKMYN